MLHSAVAKNNIAEVRKVLSDQWVNVNERDRKLQTPLHVVAEQGFVDVMDLLLAKRELDVNAKDKEQWTPLHSACSSGNLDCVERLLNHPKIDVNICNKSGSTPFQYLVRHRYEGPQEARLIGVLTKFLEKGTDINLHGHSQLVALHEACVRNNTPVIQWLLEKRAKPNEQDKRGETPLHYAVRNQNKDVAVLLLLHHADKNIASLEGHSALDLARQSGFNALETEINSAQAQAMLEDYRRRFADELAGVPAPRSTTLASSKPPTAAPASTPATTAVASTSTATSSTTSITTTTTTTTTTAPVAVKSTAAAAAVPTPSPVVVLAGPPATAAAPAVATTKPAPATTTAAPVSAVPSKPEQVEPAKMQAKKRAKEIGVGMGTMVGNELQAAMLQRLKDGNPKASKEEPKVSKDAHASKEVKDRKSRAPPPPPAHEAPRPVVVAEAAQPPTAAAGRGAGRGGVPALGDARAAAAKSATAAPAAAPPQVMEVTPVQVVTAPPPMLAPPPMSVPPTEQDMMAYIWAQQQLAMQYFAQQQQQQQEGQAVMPFPLLPLPTQCTSCRQMFAYPPGALTIDCPFCSATNTIPQQPWGAMVPPPLGSPSHQAPAPPIYTAPPVVEPQQVVPQYHAPPHQVQSVEPVVVQPAVVQPVVVQQMPVHDAAATNNHQPAARGGADAGRGGARGGRGRGRGRDPNVSSMELHDAVMQLSMTTMRLNPEEKQRLNSDFADIDVDDLTFE